MAIFDPTISFGNILTLIVTGGSVAVIVGMIRGKVDSIGERMEAVEKNMERLVTVLIDQGRQEEKILAIDGRILAQGQRLDDLSRQLNRFFEPKRPDTL